MPGHNWPFKGDSVGAYRKLSGGRWAIQLSSKDDGAAKDYYLTVNVATGALNLFDGADLTTADKAFTPD
jgi:hypothetical protein